MSIGTLFHKVTHAIGSLFTADNLTAAEKVVSELLPEFGNDLAAFSKSLPDEFTSLLALAKQAQKLVADAKGVKLSTTLAVHLAQAVLSAHWDEVVAEAEKLLTTGKL